MHRGGRATFIDPEAEKQNVLTQRAKVLTRLNDVMKLHDEALDRADGFTRQSKSIRDAISRLSPGSSLRPVYDRQLQENAKELQTALDAVDAYEAMEQTLRDELEELDIYPEYPLEDQMNEMFPPQEAMDAFDELEEEGDWINEDEAQGEFFTSEVDVEELPEGFVQVPYDDDSNLPEDN